MGSFQGMEDANINDGEKCRSQAVFITDGVTGSSHASAVTSLSQSGTTHPFYATLSISSGIE